MIEFKGAARRLGDLDLPRIGSLIGVGEDEIHAVIDVESSGSGFDKQGRPRMLFEPHVFYRNLSGAKRDAAVSGGLAYAVWRKGAYPADSYPRLLSAITIDETAALKAASWGLGQVLGENFAAAGYASVQDMVRAFVEDEAAQLEGMIKFIKTNKLDDDLRAHRWADFARGYNGAQYAENGYDTKLAASFKRWSAIRDTPYDPNSVKAPQPAPVPSPPPPPGPVIPPIATQNPVSQPAAPASQGWFANFLEVLRSGRR